MGCTGSEIQGRIESVVLMNKKPSVWLIGGGPGCQKGKICDSLVRDYKFKYLSSYDMVQFEQQRGGPDAQLISKLFKENKMMPSDLIVRLVKKAVASCGVRRFLIDGFPNSPQDVAQFDKQLTDKEIDFYGYLYVHISQKKMIESGIQANSADKEKSKSQIEPNVKQIVSAYINSSRQIKDIYMKKNKYRQINGENGADIAYQQIRQYLKNINIRLPKPVKVFFCHFDNEAHQITLCDDLIRKYGLYFYTPKALIEQAAMKPNSQQGQAIRNFAKQNKEVPTSLVLSLIRKKLQKHDYAGNYLISGYPRHISDAQQWDRHFGWQTQIVSYITFEIPDEQYHKIYTQNITKIKPSIKPDQLSKQLTKYQENQKQIYNYYKKQQKLLTINYLNKQKALDEIHTFFGIKKFNPRSKINNKKIVLINNNCGNAQLCLQVAKKRGAGIINLQQLLESKIKQNGLYSQLIQSFIRISKPVPGFVMCHLLIQQLKLLPNNLVIINGFPNSEQQLQIWQQQIGDALQTCLIIIYSQNHKYIQQNLRQKIKNKIVIAEEKDVIEIMKQNSNRISKRLKQSDWNVYTISSLSDTKQIQEKFNKAGYK